MYVKIRISICENHHKINILCQSIYYHTSTVCIGMQENGTGDFPLHRTSNAERDIMAQHHDMKNNKNTTFPSIENTT